MLTTSEWMILWLCLRAIVMKKRLMMKIINAIGAERGHNTIKRPNWTSTFIKKAINKWYRLAHKRDEAD